MELSSRLYQKSISPSSHRKPDEQMLSKPQIYVVHVTGHIEAPSPRLHWSFCDADRILPPLTVLPKHPQDVVFDPFACKLFDPASRILGLRVGKGIHRHRRRQNGQKLSPPKALPLGQRREPFPRMSSYPASEDGIAWSPKLHMKARRLTISASQPL